MSNSNKKLNAAVKEIILVHKDQYDLIGFFLDAPSSVPSDPNNQPFLLAFAEAGYGKTWLKEAFGLEPDQEQ